MNAGKIIAFIVAAILIFFGVLFLWGAGAENGGGIGWVLTGLVTVGIGFVIIFFAARSKPKTSEDENNITLKIDLPGDVNMESLKCRSCGAALTPDDVKMVAGAPVVTCPYCHTTYQLTEDPKW